jgi:hypothetical protein
MVRPRGNERRLSTGGAAPKGIRSSVTVILGIFKGRGVQLKLVSGKRILVGA